MRTSKVVISGILAVYLTYQFFRSAYNTGGWGEVINLCLGAIVSLLIMFWLLKSLNGIAVLGVCAELRGICARLYTYAGSLPDGKFPNHLRELAIGQLSTYAGRLVSNDAFWDDLPEEIGYRAAGYVFARHQASSSERTQPKGDLRVRMAELVRFLERGS